MFLKLKRFLSMSLCLIFYIFLFAGNFGGNSCSAAHGLNGSIKKFVPVDISSNFNGNAIWGINDNWDSDFKVTNTTLTTDDYKKGVDGYGAFYTTNSDRNGGSGGLPTDGKVSVGGVPFEIKNQNGNDCIKLGGAIGKVNCEISIGKDKVKNIYVMGTLGGMPNEYTTRYVNAKVEVSNGLETKISRDYNLNAFDWGTEDQTLNGAKNNPNNSLVGYTKRYNARELKNNNNNAVYNNALAMQCWELSVGDNNEGISEITVSHNNTTYPGMHLVIFAVTAEVEPDDNNTSQLIPLDIKNSFNSNEIWGINEDWSNITERWGRYYTKSPDRNNNADGLPTDGKITISNIPFNVNVLSGDDCVNISSEIGTINFSTPIKVKNLHVLGTLNGLNPATHTNPDNFNVKFYDKNNNEITQYTQTLDAYDWCYSRAGLSQIIETGTSSLVGYKDYNVRNKDDGDKIVYYGNNPAMQCWRLNKFTDDSTSFEDNQIKTIKFNKIDESPSNLMIFGITAEIDNDVTLVDLKHDSFKIVCGTSGEKQVKISTTEGADNEGIMENDNTAAFPYTPTVTEGTNYCTIYDPDKNAYYYFAVTTKKSLKIVVQAPSGLVYNGAAQQLVTGVQTKNSENQNISDNNFASNIYLRIINTTGTPTRDTGWYNLNSLTNLTATNAGTYSVYYYLNEDNLSDYDLISANVVSDTGESTDTTTIEENGD